VKALHNRYADRVMRKMEAGSLADLVDMAVKLRLVPLPEDGPNS
jgi:FixJ family two-component response regulator